MGPMFSLLFLIALLLCLWAGTFVVASLFQPARVAFRLSTLFIIGGVSGGVLAFAAFTLFFCGNVTLSSREQVIGFLLFLAVSGALGGVFLLWVCIKLRFLRLQSSGTAKKNAQSG
jgi:hypothetical protein